MENNTAYVRKMQRMGKPILCHRCKKSGGTLVRVGDDYYHKECKGG